MEFGINPDSIIMLSKDVFTMFVFSLGGGINRIKKHLAGENGSVVSCTKVAPEVRHAILGSLKETAQKAKEKRGDFEEENPFGHFMNEYDGDEVQEIPHLPAKGVYEVETSAGKGKRKATTSINAYIKGGRDSSQPTIKACMQSKEKWHNTDMSIALWFYDACIPINAVNSPFYQNAIDHIAAMGHGNKGPSYHAMRVPLLQDAKKEVQLVIDSLQTRVYLSSSVDASDIETNAQNLCSPFVEIVGPKNVVHIVTDNASNYKAVRGLLTEKYPTICWSPCAAHCINLILKDIGEMHDVKALATLASTVTVFVYNHRFTLNWLRKSKGWKEIICLGETRFATTFIALKSLHDRKDNLQALVTSGDYKKCLKMNKGKEVRQIILDEKFWNNYLIIVRIMGPLICLLCICDTDEKPSMGYVYEGMQRVIEGIRKVFKNKDRLHKPYIDIINTRWDKMLRKSPHSASYFLNPDFQYDPTYVRIGEITDGLVDDIETHVDWTNHQKRSYDPIDYESIDKTEFWVVEEEPNGELDYDELEAKLEEFPVDDVVEYDEDGDKIGEDVDLELFQRRGLGLTNEDDEWLN
ncbi:hypothetical protein ACH5RR_016066 [Cinchona calisaya]|uniref:DUF659 domain-containing protein n=1 Tax=Cinchona calisaya TaxID=153742 RepID=A0ABD2ZYK0_9GENT